jgi:phosphatidylglycerol lysyltransferase
VFTREGKLEAFATWLPYGQGKGRCLDLMRSYLEAKGVMDFLIVESIDLFKESNVEEVSLGNAPLAGSLCGNVGAFLASQKRIVQGNWIAHS